MGRVHWCRVGLVNQKGTIALARASGAIVTTPTESELVDQDIESAFAVMTDAAQHLNPAFTRHQAQARAFAFLEFTWERGYVLIPAASHVTGRARLGILGLAAGATLGYLVGSLGG